MQYPNTLSGEFPPSFDTLTFERLHPATKEKILIVDDSAVVRRSFAKNLTNRYDCYEADSVLTAFELLRSTDFSLVITDILMPGLSGVELVRKVVDTYPQTPVIVVSGVDKPQRALDAVRLGAFDYLIKPCDDEVLELTMQRALDRRDLMKRAASYKADLETRNEELLRQKKELERLQAQIVHNEKMASIGQLAAGIAHELNNPVGFLYGNLDLLDACVTDLLRLIQFYGEVELPHVAAIEAEIIKKEIRYETTLTDLSSIISDCRAGAERVRDIVQNLRTFSRLDEAEFKKADINEGIESTIRILSQYFSGGSIKLIRDYGELQSIDAFSAQLNQVWMNLLVNAAQAIGSNTGEVHIATRADADNVYISITDSGAGIDPACMSRIFDPFFTTKPVGEGTGLGLSISFGIVERHGGKIEVESRVGSGTKFTVTLPQHVKKETAASTRPEIHYSHNSHSHSRLENAYPI